jgi:hypothetical protein
MVGHSILKWLGKGHAGYPYLGWNLGSLLPGCSVGDASSVWLLG